MLFYYLLITPDPKERVVNDPNVKTAIRNTHTHCFSLTAPGLIMVTIMKLCLELIIIPPYPFFHKKSPFQYGQHEYNQH